MPASSEKMRKLFCIALNIKLKKTPASYSAEAAKMAREMTISQLSDYCKSPIRKD